jgi:DNA-directed RNA polymerase specialized sigma24 family protein
MTTRDTHTLHELLDSVEDTRDIVVRRYDADDLAQAVWKAARDDAHEAWTAWARRPSTETWAVYLAAQDREDAAFAAFDLAGARG